MADNSSDPTCIFAHNGDVVSVHCERALECCAWLWRLSGTDFAEESCVIWRAGVYLKPHQLSFWASLGWGKWRGALLMH